MSKGDTVNLVPGVVPNDYHCRCSYCQNSIGELVMSDGTNYSRLERREYYDQMEKGGEGHVAKTPLHVARWLVQAYTDPGDWVLDPTIGAGTTAVEAITQGRNVAGMEVQFSNILEANVKKNLTNGVRAEIRIGDARRIGSLLSDVGKEFALVVNNPPYSGDEHMSTLAKDRGKHMSGTFKYQEGLPNLAFLKEGPEYWEAMAAIYGECVKHLRKGGILAYGIKDMMRMKKPFMLHQKFNEMITERLGLTHVGTAFLRHWPKTQFLNTYHKFYKVHPPYFQTIGVFEKE